MTYGWIIDKDLCPDVEKPKGTNANAEGLAGPRDIPLGLLEALRGGEGEAFRMYDDDVELYYEGRIVGDYDGFEPLDDFGIPNAGCTEIRYLNNGKWVML